MKKKKSQHIPHKLTEAQKVTEQNIEGWRKVHWPSRFLVITFLVYVILSVIIAILWARTAPNW